MKQGWEIKKIGQCFSSINNGANIKQIKGASGLPITRIETISNDRFNRDRMGYANIIDYKPYSKYLLSDGDILMSHINSMKFLGRAVEYKKRNNEVILHGMNLLRLIPINDIILSYYAVLYFRTELFKKDIGAISHQSVNQASFNITALKNLDIPVPPLAEQERIVGILDREFESIDALKANAERNLQHAKDLFQSALKQELQPKEGWETVQLSDICTITSSKRIFKSEYVSNGIPFYRTKEVKEIANNHPISVELYISNERYYEIKSKFGVPQINDLLVSAVGTVGEIMVITDDKPFYFKDGNLVWLKDIQGVSSLYLKYYLKSIIDDIKDMTRGAAYNALTIEKFQTMRISFSSISEQEQIVARLDKLKEHCKVLEENYTKTIALCDDMKQALLRKAFNGEL